MHDIGIILNYLIVSNFDGETFRHTDGFDDSRNAILQLSLFYIL